ncbi:hypothetical protein [Halalkalibacter oceani]|uniref:hypothetical protein n=1 Tax=Halalkalibacter oceani TaxID=1653776 RepID=UPI003395DD90
MKFNGMSPIELEMVRDEIKKVIPVLVSIAPEVVTATCEYYKHYNKRNDITPQEASDLAVKTVVKIFGFGG